MVRHVPPGVTAHVARLRMTGAHRVSLDALLPQVKETAATLTDARCDVVAFHCTANSTSEAWQARQKLLGALRDAGAAHVTTTASAIRHAFDMLGARRIVLLTPYSAHTTEEEAGFLREAGYEVVHARGFAMKGSDEYCATPPHFWRDRAIERRGPMPTFIPQLRQHFGVPVIEEIEQKLGRPVVTSNQAVIWEALSLLGINDRRNCHGRLFDSLDAKNSAAHRVTA